MEKNTKINFDMDEIADINDEIIEVNHDFYTKKTSKVCGSLRFPIPNQIKIDLGLTAGDICYFCKYEDGFYISFKHKPYAPTKAQIKSRKLASAGQYDTLYLCLPPMLKNLYNQEITSVQLMHIQGFLEYEWVIKPLFTDFT